MPRHHQGGDGEFAAEIAPLDAFMPGSRAHVNRFQPQMVNQEKQNVKRNGKERNREHSEDK